MNTNESEFENELRMLRPVAPSAAVVEHIAAELQDFRTIAVAAPRMLSRTPAAGTITTTQRGTFSSFLRGLFWATAGAAVAVVILLSRSTSSTPVAPSAQLAQAPQSAEAAAQDDPQEQTVSELVAAADEGLRFDQDGADPQRQMRLTYLERHVWTNPQTGAVIEFEVPREDIVMMPVAMQ